MYLDQVVQLFFESVRTPQGVAIFDTITLLGNAYVVGLGTLIVLAILWKLKLRECMLPFFLGILGSVVCTSALKYLIARPRPLGAAIMEIGYSFPSWHATGALAFYGFIVVMITRSNLPLLQRRVICSLLVILILLIGVSRLYLGVHYFSDVLGGYILGALWLFLLIPRKMENG